LKRSGVLTPTLPLRRWRSFWGPPTECASGEGLKRDASVKIDGGVGSFRIIVDEDVLAIATVRGMTSVAAHGGFRRLRRDQLFGGEYSNRAYEEASGYRLEFNVAMGVGSVTLDTQKAEK